MVCPHKKCADDAPWCSHEKNVRVCASGEVVLCAPPVAFSELRLTGREHATKNQDGGQILCILSMTTADWFFEVKYLQFPEVLFYSIFEHKSMLSITFWSGHLSSCQLC